MVSKTRGNVKRRKMEFLPEKGHNAKTGGFYFIASNNYYLRPTATTTTTTTLTTTMMMEMTTLMMTTTMTRATPPCRLEGEKMRERPLNRVFHSD